MNQSPIVHRFPSPGRLDALDALEAAVRRGDAVALIPDHIQARRALAAIADRCVAGGPDLSPHVRQMATLRNRLLRLLHCYSSAHRLGRLHPYTVAEQVFGELIIASSARLHYRLSEHYGRTMSADSWPRADVDEATLDDMLAMPEAAAAPVHHHHRRRA
jgi:hypothetical protein